VIGQTCHDIEHVFLVDRSGEHPEGNILWANRQLAQYKERVVGRYVFILDDDGMLVDKTFVARLKAHAAEMGYPDAILLRSRPSAGKKLPPDSVWDIDWEMWERPDRWQGHAYSWAVSNNWWQATIAAFGAPRGGDWHFGTALIESGAEIVRLHGVYSAQSMQRGYGRKFEDCPPDWFERVMQQVDGENLGANDWRLRLWQRG